MMMMGTHHGSIALALTQNNELIRLLMVATAYFHSYTYPFAFFFPRTFD